MKTIRIGRHVIGPNQPAFIIAEAGINHNGSMELAKKLIFEAFKAGADCVKFQKRTVERILTKAGLDAPYNSPNAFAPTYGEHKRFLEFGNADFAKLKKYADSLGITFLASVWDEEAADFCETLDMPAFKIASADCTNLPLLRHIAYKGRPMLISTGAAELADIDSVIQEIELINPNIVILHTTCAYPAAYEDVNLRVLKTLRKRYRKNVGFSGHEVGGHVAQASVVMGASVIEKHFTLDKTMKGSDHAASLNPEEFRNMVFQIRSIEKSLGTRSKRILSSEVKNRQKLAKSLVSKVAIPAGTKITRDMLTVKGPGTGISPMYFESLIGHRARRDIEEDTLIQMNDLENPQLFKPAEISAKAVGQSRARRKLG
ncbi:MAG: N-acetylneuraminate synthase family protein [Planctomycetes bacterium]|nr:N-acetylneuraminate synthase family protein [Planctomycetota bacterium]